MECGKCVWKRTEPECNGWECLSCKEIWMLPYGDTPLDHSIHHCPVCGSEIVYVDEEAAELTDQTKQEDEDELK